MEIGNGIRVRDLPLVLYRCHRQQYYLAWFYLGMDLKSVISFAWYCLLYRRTTDGGNIEVYTRIIGDSYANTRQIRCLSECIGRVRS